MGIGTSIKVLNAPKSNPLAVRQLANRVLKQQNPPVDLHAALNKIQDANDAIYSTITALTLDLNPLIITDESGAVIAKIGAWDNFAGMKIYGGGVTTTLGNETDGTFGVLGVEVKNDTSSYRSLLSDEKIAIAGPTYTHALLTRAGLMELTNSSGKLAIQAIAGSYQIKMYDSAAVNRAILDAANAELTLGITGATENKVVMSNSQLLFSYNSQSRALINGSTGLVELTNSTNHTSISLIPGAYQIKLYDSSDALRITLAAASAKVTLDSVELDGSISKLTLGNVIADGGTAKQITVGNVTINGVASTGYIDGLLYKAGGTSGVVGPTNKSLMLYVAPTAVSIPATIDTTGMGADGVAVGGKLNDLINAFGAGSTVYVWGSAPGSASLTVTGGIVTVYT